MDIIGVVSILFGSLLIFILLGIPIAFTMAGISIIVGFFIWGGVPSLQGFVLGSYGRVMEFTFTAVPLYIFMAAILRYSDMAEGMYEVFYRWFGGIKGGLAAGTVFISTLFAAMVGITSVATATLGVSARPSMLKRNYDNNLTSGIIMAGSNLGIIIPPSVLMIIYATVAEVSPGKMFMAGILPGLLIVALLVSYALVVCWIDPSKGPVLPKEERFSWREKLISLKGIILPLLVIIVVLGTIFFGIATPTEAASIGVVGSLVAAASNRKLTWENLKKMMKMTVGLSSMLFWLIIGASAYAKIVTITRIGDEISKFVTSININQTLVLFIILLIFFVLGMFIDPGAILFMTAPVILPLIITFGYDLIWFGVIFILMCCIANLTPPFGISLFVLKGVAPDVKIQDLYRAIMPFVFLFIVGVIIIMIFPDIALYLPNQVGK